ncbi:MAG TPA: efflux RND transporter permease subunit, partial [Terriglobales bacterium]|nr:efflux RND transporter permease subunit [Terriglobales bacterium]
MSKFFINRPIVAMVVSILMVIVGAVTIAALPVAQFPNIVPPEVQVLATYVGADAKTIEQSVATPIEQQMSGVDNMNYMYSLNSTADGLMRLIVDYDVKTDPNTDLMLTQMRQTQAAPQLPADVTNYGVTVQKSVTAPLMLVTLYSPNGTYDARFLANYAYINLSDQINRSYGIGSVQIFGAGQYAMRLWVKPDRLAKMAITVPEIVSAIQSQNSVNPAGQVGSEPVPKGQQFTYSVQAQGRMTSPEEFGEIVIRESAGGAVVRLKDVARVELGAQAYNMVSRLDGKEAAIIAAYQLPGSNAVQAANDIRKLMTEVKGRLPEDMDYVVSLDTTQAVNEGMKEIVLALVIAIVLVLIVVFVFLQGWRATLIPLLAVPVSLVGTFIFFPLF